MLEINKSGAWIFVFGLLLVFVQPASIVSQLAQQQEADHGPLVPRWLHDVDHVSY
jgi:hypothetical protein